ncbi:MAG: type I-E CRISPR-associated protein Cse2/CasB [Clostridiales Family XIII bacterium]|jgi:CRISPR system Cascade subunit CasB|nr:type I-E CRISPR-associated protein Cse2/CasB [Clostridiales Family XIII bacterium]
MSDNATMIHRTVSQMVERLTEAGKGKRAGMLTPWATAMLAKLRRAAGTSPCESADVWEVTIGALSEELTKWERGKAEFAVHTALTLFGVHQQGSHESISKNGVGFGKAVKSIVLPDLTNEPGVRRRFNALVTTLEFKELANHARGLVQLMRTRGLGFDYPKFAVELYRYQLSSEQRDYVRMSWGRDFYAPNKDGQNENLKEDKK